jgi:demethylmenaquinone methyltransferase/2-methoxy-6-polyprenyl-1,4-benzoquinol methylase
MFGTIAARYDLLNHVLSANLDRGWRRAATRELPEGLPCRVLDLCGGTGDLAIEIARRRPESTVICCDFSHPMLALAREKLDRRGLGRRCWLLEADGLRLPFAAGTFDAVTIAFGLRNLADPGAGLREIHRVLRAGGRLVVLEFSRPTGRWLSRLYAVYLNRVVPRLGRTLGKDPGGAYVYLARTIAGFAEPSLLAAWMREAGFAGPGWRHLTGGIVAIHTALKAPPEEAVRAPRAAAAARPSARAIGSPPAGR